MKSLPWFRLYTEMIDDEKLGLLAFEDRWHFVALLCLKGKGVLDSEPDTEMLQRKVAHKMGLTCSELEKVAMRLSRMKLIDFDTFQPIAWDERQMQSDSSTERVKAHRERLKQVKQTRNVPVTAQEEEEEGDTEEDKEKGRGVFDFKDGEENTNPTSGFPPSDEVAIPEQKAPLMAGAICVALKSIGMAGVNPSNPNLKDLIDKGADIGMFVDVGRECIKKQKPFSYLLAVVRGRLNDSVELAMQAVSKPAAMTASNRTPESFKESDARIARDRWEQMTGRTHPDNLQSKAQAAGSTELIHDITPRFLSN